MTNKFYSRSTPEIIANSFIELSLAENYPLTPGKLQQLLYLFYRESIFTGLDIPSSHAFHVWQCGPVLLEVYQIFESYGDKTITEYIYTHKDSSTYITITKGSQFHDVAQSVWRKHKTQTQEELRGLLTQEGGAWYRSLCEHLRAIPTEYISEERFDL